jgi:hypothetical protein
MSGNRPFCRMGLQAPVPSDTECKGLAHSRIKNPLGSLMKNKAHSLRNCMLGVLGVSLAFLGTGVVNAANLQIAGQLLVDLHNTRGLTTSDVTVQNWTNYGSVGGTFDANPGPTNATIGGEVALGFNGSQRLKSSFPVPPQMVGQTAGKGNPYSIEVWAYNPDIPSEECMFGWGKRGGPDLAAAQFNYGSSADYGAVTHWGWPDMGWGTGGAPLARKQAH